MFLRRPIKVDIFCVIFFPSWWFLGWNIPRFPILHEFWMPFVFLNLIICFLIAVLEWVVALVAAALLDQCYRWGLQLLRHHLLFGTIRRHSWTRIEPAPEKKKKKQFFYARSVSHVLQNVGGTSVAADYNHHATKCRWDSLAACPVTAKQTQRKIKKWRWMMWICFPIYIILHLVYLAACPSLPFSAGRVDPPQALMNQQLREICNRIDDFEFSPAKQDSDSHSEIGFGRAKSQMWDNRT